MTTPPPPEPGIASTANPRIKAVVRLRERRERDKTGLTVIDGIREIDRALDAGIDIVEAFAADDLIRTPAARTLRARLGAASVPVTEVSAIVLERLAFGDRDDGLIVVARLPQRSLAAVRPGQGPGAAVPLVAVIEGVEKPGNLGAILRSADGAGLDAVIVADPRTDLANPNVIRASLGTIFTRPVVAATTADTVEWLVRQGLAIVAARVDAPVVYTEADLTRPLAIVLGAEAEGLTAAWASSIVEPVRLPMLGAADSLNLSVAAAILFYEALRQRRGSVSRMPR